MGRRAGLAAGWLGEAWGGQDFPDHVQDSQTRLPRETDQSTLLPAGRARKNWLGEPLCVSEEGISVLQPGASARPRKTAHAGLQKASAYMSTSQGPGWTFRSLDLCGYQALPPFSGRGWEW